MQLILMEEIIENHLNVKQTEERIAKLYEKKEKKNRPKLKGINKDVRIAMNTIRQSLSMITKTGINVESDEKEFEDFYQITVKIPKKK